MKSRRHFIKQTSFLIGGLITPLPSMGTSRTRDMIDQKQYDVIIVGSSYAGLSTAMALGRALRQVLVIDGGNPCNKQTPHSHNFLTNDGKTPGEIVASARGQVKDYRCVTLLNGFVINALKTYTGFNVELETGEKFESKKLVFATGIKDMLPSIPGFAECWGISVLHCPYCHGFEVRHQKTGILANGDLAFELSSLISNWTNDLTLFTNGPSSLANEQLEKVKRHNIEIVEDRIERIDHNEGYIRQIAFENGTTAPLTALYARLPFVQHSDVPEKLGCHVTPEGYIKIDPAQKTSVPGVFACGDNATRMRTVANAVSMGTTTGLMVNKELIEEEF
jgi:thioredoxin reductase